MKIEIFLGNKGYVDFSKPVKMLEEQRKQFIKLLESIYDSSIIKPKKINCFKRVAYRR